jgi:hypothetical protein
MQDDRYVFELNFDEFRKIDLSNLGDEDHINSARLQYWIFHWRGHFDCWGECDSKWNFGDDKHDDGYYCHECEIWHHPREVFQKGITLDDKA